MTDAAHANETTHRPFGTERLRVALVTETWPPEINGVAMTLARLVRALRRRGHDVMVARPRQSHEGAVADDARELLQPGMPLPFYPTLRLGLPSTGSLRAAWRRHRPQVVHIATEGFLGISALRAALDLGLPATSGYHTHWDDFARHYGAWWLVPTLRAHMRAFHNRTRTTVVPSPDVRDRLRDGGVTNCRILGRGVDTEQFHPDRRDPATRAAWGVREDQLVLICAGRVAPEKNLDLVVRVFRLVQARDPGVRLVLVGDGPLHDRLARCEGVITVGAVPHDEVGRHLAAADLFLFASMTETFGNVLCEAMACGLPSVSFDYAASATWVEHGRNGWKVPFGDEDAFVREALEACRCASRRREVGAEAHRSMAAMGWDAIVGRFEGILGCVVREHAARARRRRGSAGGALPAGRLTLEGRPSPAGRPCT